MEQGQDLGSCPFLNQPMDTLQHLKTSLESFHGTDVFYNIPLIRTRYTNGINFLAQVAQCFWLVTDASVIARSLMNRSHFITIDFKRLSEKEQELQGFEAVLEYGDGNGNLLESHKYHGTDFPLDSLRLFFTNNTLMLPSEY